MSDDTETPPEGLPDDQDLAASDPRSGNPSSEDTGDRSIGTQSSNDRGGMSDVTEASNDDEEGSSEKSMRKERQQLDDAADTQATPTRKVAPEREKTGQPIPTMARILSVVMIILGIVAVGVLFYRVMAGFFVPLFLAVLLVVLCRPVHEWILQRNGQRRRLACLLTTSLILAIVLLPILTVISVAAGQFTSMISHVNYEDLTGALQRAREQLGVALVHPEQFRRLDQIADELGNLDDQDLLANSQSAEQQVNEAMMLVKFLQEEESGQATAVPAADNAEQRLLELLTAVRSHRGFDAQDPLVSSNAIEPPKPAQQQSLTTPTSPRMESLSAKEDDSDDRAVPGNSQTEVDTLDSQSPKLIQRIRDKEAFHRKSVIASAAIRAWMREFLGGTFYSQARLFANPSSEDFRSVLTKARQSLQPRFVTLTSATGSFLVDVILGIMVMVIAVYFFLHDGASMIRTLMRLSPLDDRYEERLLLEFERTSRAVVLASVSSAVVQGLLASVAFYFLGFQSVIFLFLITSLMALVPFLGAASVWVPCSAYLAMIDQRWGSACFLFIYGATIVSSIDNVIKMYVLHGRSTMHPLFALLSVLGGVKVFGPIGILVGPMVVVFLQTLLEILNHELEERDQLRKTRDDQMSPAVNESD